VPGATRPIPSRPFNSPPKSFKTPAKPAKQAQPADFNTPYTNDPNSGLYLPHNAEYSPVEGGYAVLMAPLVAAGLYPNSNGDTRSNTPEVAVAVTVSHACIYAC
jgi:hypothetical protein